MSNYRRAWVPGGAFFFTLVTAKRRNLFANDVARRYLGDAFRECQQRRPFDVNAIVLLPDHLHAIWTLPRGDSDFSSRWGIIKASFTKRWLAFGGGEVNSTGSQRTEYRRGVWQRRFWEHTLQDEDDFERHFDYIHYNPVRHGLVRCPAEWKWSTFHKFVKLGVYDKLWGRGWVPPSQEFPKLKQTTGE